MSEDNWKFRSEGMRCKTCMFFVPKVYGANGQIVVMGEDMPSPVYDLGRCRRHAPTMAGWPVVFVNDWCGDHKLDENKWARQQDPLMVRRDK
jgi:hypothetical protein